MANPFFAEMQAVAEELISEFGQAGTVTRYANSGPAYDPVQTPTDYPCKLVFDDIDFTKIDGSLIEMGDKKGYISTVGLTIELTTADKLVVAGKEHVFKAVKPLSPGGFIVVYEFLVAS